MRTPIASKTYYEESEQLLSKQINDLFVENPKGPGALPATRLDPDGETDQGIIVPHAPYKFAGPCMSWAYKALAENKQDSDLYIIVAQSPHGEGTSTETFVTPMGQIRPDQDFIKALIDKGHMQVNEEAHAKEALIELQLPFLQFIRGIHKDQIKIVPLLVGSETSMNELSVDIKETLVDQGKKATFIFISNLTSYGRDFHYVPFTEHIPENIAKVDKVFIDAIKAGEKSVFEETAKETTMYPSGYFALELYFAFFNKPEIFLEQNYLSGDINDNYNNTVSYASFVIK